MNSRIKIIILALGHGLNDLMSGYFLGSLASQNSSFFQIGLAITIYNVLAFGGQYPVALLLEKLKNIKKLIVLSYLLNLIAVLSFSFIPVLSIIFAGIASAIYHVAGGSYCAENNKAVNIGLFAAPGIAGLVAGGFFAWKQYAIIPFLIPIAIVFLIILFKIEFERSHAPSIGDKNEKRDHVFDQHDIIMILLLLIISLRSVTWNVFQLIHENNFEWLIAIALAAAIGKIAGGWLADKIGWRLYAIASTIIATPLLTLFKKELIFFCIGIGILQSGIPATTSLLIRSLKGKTARGISLSFGTAIIIGAIGNIFKIDQILQQLPFLLLISIVLLTICSIWYQRIVKSLN